MGDKQTFYAPPGTVTSVRDIAGTKELIRFGDDGKFVTDNPLYINVLSLAADTEVHPVSLEPVKAAETPARTESRKGA